MGRQATIGCLLAPLFAPLFAVFLALVNGDMSDNLIKVVGYYTIESYAGFLILGMPAAHFLKRTHSWSWSWLLLIGLIAGAATGFLTQVVTGQIAILYEMNPPIKAVIIFCAVIFGLGAIAGLGVAALYGFITGMPKSTDSNTVAPKA